MLLAVTAIVAVTGVLAGAGAAVADPVAGSIATGHDVSYPQCGRALPTRDEIAVVGVNAGTGTATNPCLAQQLAWGDRAAADGATRTADVYVNTADPGLLGDWWPNADVARSGTTVPNPYGSCAGAENPACAYVYGYSIALDDARTRGVSRPQDRTWWLDIETTNSWSWDRSANRAVLEGMTDALHGLGAEVGLYSTTRQWSLIVDQIPTASPMAGLNAWLASAATRRGAEALCAAAPLTPGGRIAMAQWVADSVDHNVACSAGGSDSQQVAAGIEKGSAGGLRAEFAAPGIVATRMPSSELRVAGSRP